MPREVCPLCKNLLEVGKGGECTEFHRALAEQARRNDRPVLHRCPAGLLCFALPSGSRSVSGGPVRLAEDSPPPPRLTGDDGLDRWETLPKWCGTRLDSAIQALNTLLGPASEEASDPAEERRKEHEALVFQAAALLSSALNLDQLMNDVLSLALQLTRSDAGSLHLVENQRLSRHVSMGSAGAPAMRPGQHRLRPSLMGWLQERLARQSTETIFASSRPAHQPEHASALYMPLVLHDRTAAHLTLYNRHTRQFTSEEIQTLEAFATQAAMAVENAQTFEAEQKRARESTALYQAARAIGESQARREVLESSARALARTAEADRALVFLADRHRPVMTLATAIGITPDQQDFFSAFRLSLSHLGEEVRESLAAGHPLVLTSPPADSPALARLVTLLPSASCLLVPILSDDKLAGLVLLDDSRGQHPFPEAAVWLVMALAVQVGIALRRANLISELEDNLQRFRALYHVSTAVTGTLSLPRLLELIVHQALSLVAHSACAVLVLDETGEDFYVHTSAGLSEGLLELPVQADFARLAVEQRRVSVRYLDPDEELAGSRSGKILREAGFGGVLSAPLVARRRMVGVLNCFAPAGRTFHRQEVRLLRGFANHAAIAVDNARIHTKLRGKIRELATLFKVSRAVTSTLQLDRVLRQLVRQVVKTLKADAATLMLIEGSQLTLKACEGLNPSGIPARIPVGEGVLGLAAETGRPLTVIDGEESQMEFPGALRAQGLKTILSVPIEHRGLSVGVLNVYHRSSPPHAAGHLNLLAALGGQAAVAIENARIYAEKERVSALLHEALIPRQDLGHPGFEVGHRFVPSHDLSGDYYDLISLGPKRCGLVIADVSGKGADAAIETVRAKHLLRSYAMSGHPPREILRMLNDHLGRVESGDARQVTVFYAEADVGARRLYFSSAGHEPPILCVPDTEPVILEADGLMLGVLEDVRFEERMVEIPEGSILILYTDGITEARDPKGRFFGLERLLDVVRGHRDTDTPQYLADRILARVRGFCEQNLADDFSVMVVRF